MIRNTGIVRRPNEVPDQITSPSLTNQAVLASTIYDVAIAEAAVENALSTFDATLELLGTQGQDPTGGNAIASVTDRLNNILGSTLNNTRNGGVEAALSKRTATGMTVRAASRTDRTRGNPIFNTVHNSIWEQTFEISATQPLLGPDPRGGINGSLGGGALVNRIPIILPRINSDVTLSEFEANIRDQVMSVETAYWDLHFAYRNLEAAKIGRDSAQVTWNMTYAKRNIGTEGVQAEAQSREQYFFFRSQLEDALRQLQNSENVLRYLMGIAPTDGRLIRPSDEPTAARVAFDWKQIRAESLMRSAELRQQRWTIKQAELAAGYGQASTAAPIGCRWTVSLVWCRRQSDQRQP